MVKISVLLCVFSVVPAVLGQFPPDGYEYRAPPPLGAAPAPASASTAQRQHRVEPPPLFPQADASQQIPQHAQYDYQYNNAQSSNQNVNYNRYNHNFANINSLSVNNAQQTAQAYAAYNPSFANTQAQRPVVTKHIYFHLPPPDEVTPPPPVQPPRKIYNIIFIKLPAQKSASAARLQQLINQRAAVENKTLIYVLVKKPETQPVQPITSKPEVFFVKYKEPRNIAPVKSIGGAARAPALPSAPAPVLLPGLVNGHGN